MEQWKDIEGFEGIYQVSNLGRVKSLKRRVNGKGNYWYTQEEKILKPFVNKKGYLGIVLYNNYYTLRTTIHRLVASAFIPNDNSLPQVNHKDENKLNNCVDNLEWCDNWYNEHYGNKTKNICKQINQYDKQGNFIKSFSSITEALKELNIQLNDSSISCVAKGKRKSAFGYIWKYSN